MRRIYTPAYPDDHDRWEEDESEDAPFRFHPAWRRRSYQDGCTGPGRRHRPSQGSRGGWGNHQRPI